MEFSGDQLSYTNYWFRHLWEYWWPLYPGVLLTTTLAELNLWLFVLFLCPLTVIAIYSGYLVLKGFGDDLHQRKDNSVGHDRPPIGPFIIELIPILIVIGLGLGMGTIFTFAFRSYGLFKLIAQETGLVLALLVAIGWVWCRNGLSAAQRWQVLSNRQLLRMAYMVASILIFKGILTDSHAVETISTELLRWHIPLMPITVMLPFFVGGVVGITIAFVGTTFPILIALIQSFGEGHFILGYMMLGLASGFVGVLFSPLHLCLLLSNEYFETSLGAVYRHLWFPCTFLLVFSIAYFWTLHWLNPF